MTFVPPVDSLVSSAGAECSSRREKIIRSLGMLSTLAIFGFTVIAAFWAWPVFSSLWAAGAYLAWRFVSRATGEIN